MRKNIAAEWLKASYTDLVVAEKILGDDFVTNVTAFHCQQSVEKSFYKKNNTCFPPIKKQDMGNCGSPSEIKPV